MGIYTITKIIKRNKNINYIGIEKYDSVLIKGVEKASVEGLDNIYFLNVDAIKLCDYFKKGEVDKIFLNFSDPWPKTRHAKRRLTSPNFLKLYDKFFKGKNVIIQKTDNDNLFSYSVETIKNYGYEIEEISYDLHNTDILNVMTEYEEKFSKQGVKIKYLKAIK